MLTAYYFYFHHYCIILILVDNSIDIMLLSLTAASNKHGFQQEVSCHKYTTENMETAQSTENYSSGKILHPLCKISPFNGNCKETFMLHKSP